MWNTFAKRGVAGANVMTNQEEIRAIIQGHATRGDIYNKDEGEEFDKVEIALRALKRYGDELIPTLVESLSDPDGAVREVAWIGSNDELSHVMAAGSILRIEPTKADDLLPVLIDALESDDDGIKMEAIWQLERLGEMAIDAVPALRRLLDDHSTVSMPASDAIHRITGDPRDVINLGITLLDHEEWLQRCVGAEHLRMLGAKAHLAVPRLQWATLDDENDLVRNTAMAALKEIEG